MDQITAQVMVFFIGGFETTSVTISFCLYELAKNVNIQKCVMTEIDRILEEYGGEITYDGVKEMKFLDQVVSGEILALRLRHVNLLK
jgi:cytochrome P450 family 6